MPVDISKLIEKLPAGRRAAAARVGTQFGSASTLRQADETLGAWERYRDEVVLFGYGGDDAEELRALRAALARAGAGREGALAGKKTTSQALAQALEDGKAARLRAHAILARARLLSDTPATVQQIDGVLAQTRSAGADARRLLEQLALLQSLLEGKEVAALIKKRGGPEAVAVLRQARAELDAADAEHVSGRGAPAETAEMDLLDGLIVEHVRDARRAARAAGRALGRPEIAHAFELGALYEGRRGRHPTSPTPPDAPAPTPAP